MLVVTVEIWPGGGLKGRKDLGYLVIGNDGTGTSESGSYLAGFVDDPENFVSIEKFKKLKDHKRSDGFWPLVNKALGELL